MEGRGRWIRRLGDVGKGRRRGSVDREAGGVVECFRTVQIER